MLLGRDAELGQIARLLDEVDGGRSAFVLVAGEPGIGKSALLGAVADDASSRGWLVFTGRATEFERAMPFSVLVDALDAHLAQLDAGRLARMGVEHVPELAAVFPSVEAPAGHPAPAAVERYQVHRAVSGLLTGLAATKPVVLVLDDLNWSDEATLEALSALARRPPEGRVLVAAAHRPDPALDDLGHQLDRQGFPRLRLGPLGAEDAAKLIEDRVPAPVRERVLEQAGGNPFFLEQLARSPTDPGGRAVAGWDLLIPTAIVVSIRQQVEQLSPEAQRLLQGVAVAGQPADLRLASVAAGLDYETALATVDEALAADVLRQAGASTAFSFRHPLVRRVVYENAGPGWRIAAHARLRAALIDMGADVTLIAHHIEHGAALGDEEGVAILAAAADRVLGRDPAGAAAWLDAALRLLPEEHSERRASLEEQRGIALLAAGDLASARRALRAAGTDTARTNYRLAEVERWLGHEQDAVRRLERARELAGDGTEEDIRVRIEIELMLIHEWNLRYDEAREAAATAARVAEATGDPVVIAEVEGVIATTLVQTDPRAALEVYERSAAAVGTYDDHDYPAHPMSLWDLGWAATYLERYEEAIAHFERGLRITRDRQAPGNVVMFLADRAEPYYRLGRVREARELAEEAVEAARVTPHPRYLWWSLVRLALVIGRSGDAERVEEVVRDCERAAQELPPSPLVRLWTAHARSAVAAARGDWRGAAACLAAAAGGPELPLLAPIDRNRPRLVMTLAALADDDVATADRWAREAEEWAAHTGQHAQRGWAEVARAHVRAAGGDVAGAAATAGEAATSHERAGSRLEAERARVLQARWLGELGDRDGACALLDAAEAQLHAMGADVDHAGVARELRRFGRRLPRRAPAPTGGDGAASGDDRLALLSAREREVADLVAGGSTNRDIAETLFLSQKTVESHLRNIFTKVGVGSRTALAALVAREQREDAA